MGYLALFLGDFNAGAAHLLECAAHLRTAGSRGDLSRVLANLGAAHWFRGEFEWAYRELEKAQTLAGEARAPAALQLVIGHRAWLDVCAGRYDAARNHAQYAHEVEKVSQDRRFIPLGVLGWAALAKEACAEAAQPLNELATRMMVYTNHSIIKEYRAWALAALGRADYGLGNLKKAQQHLREALEIVVEIRAFIPLLHLMPVIPVVLADEDDPRLKERAVELYALATSHPFVAKAQLFEDVAGRNIRASTASLPPDVIAAAQERGSALDWWETAEALLDELKGHGWSR
jgi:tetratricopeptide (TPR) repeat protein